MATLLNLLLGGAGIGSAAYFGYKYIDTYEELHNGTDDYYALNDFGYANTRFVNPISMYEIITLPDIWEQVWLQLTIATSVYAVAAIAGFFVKLPVGVLATAIYIHWLLYVMKQV